MHLKLTSAKWNSPVLSLVLLCLPFPLVIPPLIPWSRPNTWASSLTLLFPFPSPPFLSDLTTFLHPTLVQAARISLWGHIGFLFCLFHSPQPSKSELRWNFITGLTDFCPGHLARVIQCELLGGFRTHSSFLIDLTIHFCSWNISWG